MISYFHKNKTIIFIWLIYVISIHLLPLLFSFFDLTKELPFSIRSYLIDFWGYSWDGSLYLKVSQTGYQFPLQAFFPGFPLILKILNFFLPLALIFKLNTFLILPLLIQLKNLLVKLNFNHNQIKYSIISFLAFPTSFFLNANYTETIYILISCYGLNSLLENKPLKTSFSGFFLSFIKITSVVFTFVFFYHYYQKLKLKIFSYKNWSILGLVLFTTFGIVGYFSFLQYSFGNFQIYFKAQNEWGRSANLIPFVSEFKEVKSKFVYEKILELVVFIFGIFLFIYSYKKIPTELYLFSLLHFLIPLSTGTFLSINRLFLLSFPVLIWLFAKISDKKRLYWAIFATMLILQIVGLNLFIKGHFIG